MKVMFLVRGAEYIGVESLSACLKADGHLTNLVFDPGFDDTFYFRAPFFKKLNRWPGLIKSVKDFKPDVLAVSSISNTYPYICELVKEIKKAYSCFTVIGGVHASAIPEHALREGLFDAVCIGEGEQALVELVRCLDEKKSPLSLKNFCFIKDGEIIKNPLRPLIDDLDTLPFPDKDLFYKYGAFSTTLAILSGRGCPYSCNFCVNDWWRKAYQGLGRYIRQYSPERMISELKYFTGRYPIKNINFQDDILTMNKKWLADFSRIYKKSIKLPFQCNIHPGFTSEEIAGLLKEAGCVSVCMGVQTAVQKKRMEVLGRNETNEEIENAVTVLKRHKLPIYLEYIFGLPDETAKDIDENITFNRKLNPTNTATFVLYPFPGTSILAECQKRKIISKKDVDRVFKGEGSYHYGSYLELPSGALSEATAQLFPILTKLPHRLSMLLIRIFSKKYLRWTAGILQLFLLPFNNFFQFRERIDNYSKMFRYGGGHAKGSLD